MTQAYSGGGGSGAWSATLTPSRRASPSPRRPPRRAAAWRSDLTLLPPAALAHLRQLRFGAPLLTGVYALARRAWHYESDSSHARWSPPHEACLTRGGIATPDA